MKQVKDIDRETIYAEHKHIKALRRKGKRYNPTKWATYQSNVKRNKAKTLSPPEHFSIIQNTDEVVAYFDTVRFAQESREFVKLDLSNIDYIDLATISLLMAHMFDGRLPTGYLTVIGPGKEQPRDLFKRVEFHKTVTSGNSSSAHFLSRQGFADNIEHKLSILKRVAEFRGDEIDTDLNPILTEILANTNNHASLRDKGVVPWLITLEEKPDDDTIKFCVTDLGVGIYERLVFTNNEIKRFQIPSWITSFFQSSQNKTLAKNIPKGLISSTNLFYRGQGMKNIHSIVTSGSFKNFNVITNKAHLNILSLDENQKDTLVNFRGTLYYWSIKYAR